jgi:LEM3 (ligand-effect modulator 3) family / CDC50 family
VQVAAGVPCVRKGTSPAPPSMPTPVRASFGSEQGDGLQRPSAPFLCCRSRRSWNADEGMQWHNQELERGPCLLQDSNIAWSYDVNHLYGNYTAVNFNTRTYPQFSGGGNLTQPLKESYHFMVWMRVASHPSFRKLYGTINQTIEAGELAASAWRCAPR